MQEEIEQKSAALMINGTKFSLRTLKSAALKLLAHRQNPSAPGVKHRGKQTVKPVTPRTARRTGPDRRRPGQVCSHYGDELPPPLLLPAPARE